MPASPVEELVAPDGSWVERRVVVDHDVYELERERIFGRIWNVVAHESQVRAVGSFVASWVGEDPVLVSRRRDGGISVVLNSCSHRGSRVCRVDEGRAGSWTCPNHGWTYGLDGQLLGVPHREAGYGSMGDRKDLGLVEARVEVRHGLVFASFGEGGDLEDHLGDSSFYLESIFDRYVNGVEVLGGALRSLLHCNWKLAMENLGTDLQHPEFAHGAFMDLWPDPVMEFMEDSEQVLTSSGNPACLGMRPPPYTEPDGVLSTITDAAERREVLEWFERTNREAVDRLGAERAGMYVFTGSVFPNLSFLSGISAVFVLHPRGARTTEWWSWCLVPVDAPSAVRAAWRRRFMLTCGPGGLILAEDAENWADMTRSAASEVGAARRFHVGRGLGEEYSHPHFPGRFAAMRSEHAQRGFWRNWREAMAGAPTPVAIR